MFFATYIYRITVIVFGPFRGSSKRTHLRIIPGLIKIVVLEHIGAMELSVPHDIINPNDYVAGRFFSAQVAKQRQVPMQAK